MKSTGDIIANVIMLLFVVAWIVILLMAKSWILKGIGILILAWLVWDWYENKHKE